MVADGMDPAPIVDHIVELAREQGTPVRYVSRGELESAARTESPQGVVAFADPLRDEDLVDLAAGNPFLLALDGVTDPQNLGAVLRCAECAGVDGVILPRHRASRITASAMKSAAGAAEYLRYVSVPGLPAALRRLSEFDVWVVGRDATGDVSIHDLKVADAGIVLVLGSEGQGLSRLVSERCDTIASIPMRGELSSLNVAAAAAIACFEISHHR